MVEAAPNSNELTFLALWIGASSFGSAMTWTEISLEVLYMTLVPVLLS